jgi:hypothetical protein
VDEIGGGIIAHSAAVEIQSRVLKYGGIGSGQADIDGFRLHVQAVLCYTGRVDLAGAVIAQEAVQRREGFGNIGIADLIHNIDVLAGVGFLELELPLSVERSSGKDRGALTCKERPGKSTAWGGTSRVA